MNQSNRERSHANDDAAGGVEGGMPSGSAGGPGLAEQERQVDKDAQADGSKTPSTNVEDKIGDLGKGSHEQTQGGAKAGGS
jgi:hypothetical protein